MSNLFNILETCGLWKQDETMFDFDVPLKELSSFKTGGKADAVFTPDSTFTLKKWLIFFTEKSIPISIIGKCTNLLISDRGIRGIVIDFSKFSQIEITEAENGEFLLKAGAGVLIDRLASFAAENALSGLEAFGGLPGSVGGAVFMNARCYDKAVSDVLFSVEITNFLNGTYQEQEYKYDPNDWDYKKSPFQGDPVGIKFFYNRKLITSAVFKLKKGNADIITSQTASNKQNRIAKGQFKYPSAGSIFKNNRLFGIPSGKIIDEAGLCGLSCGQAQVAPYHGNFIINKGEAKAESIRQLIEKVHNIVFEKTGFSLEPEIIFAGEWE